MHQNLSWTRLLGMHPRSKYNPRVCIFLINVSQATAHFLEGAVVSGRCTVHGWEMKILNFWKGNLLSPGLSQEPHSYPLQCAIHISLCFFPHLCELVLWTLNTTHKSGFWYTTQATSVVSWGDNLNFGSVGHQKGRERNKGEKSAK